MPIDIRVQGDPASCAACGDGLAQLAADANRHGQGFDIAKQQSETAWQGGTGDDFRTRVQAMGDGVHEIAGQINQAATAVRLFGDALTTVQARMRDAAGIAAAAGLPVTAEMIGDPDEIDPASQNLGPQVRRAEQVAAYNEAVAVVVDARRIEKAAHEALQSALSGAKTATDAATSKWGWMAAGAVQGYVGTSVSQANKWATVAEDRAAQLDKFKTIAADYAAKGDPYPEAIVNRAINEFAPAADDAARTAASNARLVGGATDNSVGRFLGMGLVEEGAESSSLLRKVGSKIPVAGVGLTAIQTGLDVSHDADKGAGQISKDVGKDVGGFVAGTAATELILMGAAGGPATFAAVTVGVGVAYGVGELVDHWSDWF